MSINNVSPNKESADRLAIISVILGGISAILPFIINIIFSKPGVGLGPFAYLTPSLLGFVIGLIIGFRGLRSRSKTLAKVGVSVCLVGLTLWLMYSLYIWYASLF
ncbi:hypothetical protein [Dehalogenimonas sp. 4OHTPN]|uniref:DUF4190 domain-containing protein n=1 Tax=Dehalogenimonas sp. 4OHTPN TaxID=3166643 RepID=A0AAU8G9U4_9CHLR